MQIKTLQALQDYVAELKKIDSPPIKLLVSLGTCGLAAGGKDVKDAIYREIEDLNLSGIYEIIEVGCMGLCHSEPTIALVDEVENRSLFYGDVTPSQIPMILQAGFNTTAQGTRSLERTWYYPEEEENSNNALQAKVVLRNTGRIDPENLDHYIANGGYQALFKILQSDSSQDVIDTILESGLRGRGGGGFPTGRKWQFAANQNNPQKYIICNADEGDPGAFMDRAVLEGDPHSVLEAMAIGGYAIGANHGIIYIRAEYPLAVKRLQNAINQAEESGLLGNDIAGSGFNFKIELKYGAGAFVCGEETALIHSIEGKRGEPTFKPPFPAIEGLWKYPTVVNNVETYANIPAIIRKGAEWFKSIGTPSSPGTKVFALAGKVSKVGLVEVPMGLTLQEIIFELGGGIKYNKAFKAVQTGGPSGGCITAKNLDTPIDYDSLKVLGSMMGSGGMIVMDEDDCMVNIARFFLEFTLDESCGKCTPCRIGNRRLFEMLDSICKGQGTMETLHNLKELSMVIKDTALCGLGQTSPNPILSTLANFEDEYLAHIQENRCPAGACSDLVEYSINDKCVGCTVCAKNCPVGCITGDRKQQHYIDKDKCIKCGVCYQRCKFHAVDKK